MPEITDWSDLTYDFVTITKPYRAAAGAEPETVRFELRDDVPTSVMVRMFGVGTFQAAYQAALAEVDDAGQPRAPDYDAAATAMERVERETLRALAGVFHHTYAETSVPEWEAELARIFTDAERMRLMTLFFIRSRASRTPPRGSDSPASKPTTTKATKATTGATAPTSQGATHGRSGRSASGGDAATR